LHGEIPEVPEAETAHGKTGFTEKLSLKLILTSEETPVKSSKPQEVTT
jgi:hypothetical protein